MHAYMIIAKIPRNPRQYISRFREYLLSKCSEKKIECIVNYISGRFIVFSEDNICEEDLDFKNIIDCMPVEIYRDENEVIKRIASIVKNCESFAVRSNHLHVAQDIGGKVNDITGVKADLENPHCEVKVELRNGIYILLR